MKPATITLTIYQGQTFDDSFIFEDVEGEREDFTGYEARMQIRPFTASNKVYETLSTANGYIAELGDDGVVQFALPASVTAGLSNTHEFETWWYDLEIFNDDESDVQRLMQGAVVINPNTTRPVVP